MSKDFGDRGKEFRFVLAMRNRQVLTQESRLYSTLCSSDWFRTVALKLCCILESFGKLEVNASAQAAYRKIRFSRRDTQALDFC